MIAPDGIYQLLHAHVCRVIHGSATSPEHPGSSIINSGRTQGFVEYIEEDSRVLPVVPGHKIPEMCGIPGGQVLLRRVLILQDEKQIHVLLVSPCYFLINLC